MVFGELYLIDLVGFTIGRPLLTGVRLLLEGETGSAGKLAPDVTAVCPFCGDRFPFLRAFSIPSPPSTVTAKPGPTTPLASSSPPEPGKTRICKANVPTATSHYGLIPLWWDKKP